MDAILKKLIEKKPITTTDIQHSLYLICDKVHAECDDECPVYFLNGSEAPVCSEEEHFGGCKTFKDGKAMLKFINSCRLAPKKQEKRQRYEEM